MSKLRGSKLEAEVDKCRGECNWLRLEELLPFIRAKGSGLEKQTSLFEGELELEHFIERQKDRVNPSLRFRDRLCTAEGFLKQAIALNNNVQDTVVMEAYLLLAKLHYLVEEYVQCLADVKNSQLDQAKTLFRTLRSLKLAAEGYAIKGFALKHQMQGQPNRGMDNIIPREQMLSCFDQAVELGLSYVSEFEKSINSSLRVPAATPLTQQQHSHSEVFHIGDLLVMAMECAPSVLSKRNTLGKRSDYEGVEKYRHIMTTLSDKTAVEQIQQRLCRQLAEVLLRSSFESSYSITGSPAINQKSDKLNFYTGSQKNFYAPSSRVEEIILVLLISELIASRSVKSLRHGSDAWLQSRSVDNLKQVHNLLSVVLSRLRQHSLLSLLMDRAVQYAGANRYIWRQFGLALACTGRFSRAIKVFEHGIALEHHSEGALTLNTVVWDSNERLIEHMQVAKMLIEQQQDAKLAMWHAEEALKFCTSDSLLARCRLLYAMAFSLRMRNEISFNRRKEELAKSINNFKLAVSLDPHDDLTHLFCALEFAEARNLSEARASCNQALELNPYNPVATMLMALIFTTKHDYKNALKLVLDATLQFPNHYGLLVLKLRLESKFGRVDRALRTSRALLSFWRCPTNNLDMIIEDDHQTYHTLHSINNESSAASAARQAENGSTAQRQGSVAMLTSKDVLGPVTPIFTAPLGIPSSALPQHGTINSTSTLEMSEAASNLGYTTTTRLSELAATASTASDSLGIRTSSSVDWATMNTFRVRANIWVELAELFIDNDYVSELTTCVNEAFALFPSFFQVMYLKGRLALLRAEKLSNFTLAASIETREKLCVEARTHFLAALSANPTHWQSFCYLGRVYRLEANVKMAEKMLRDALAVEPLQEELWQELGQVLAEQHCFEEANECFKTAANIDCTSPLMPFIMIPRILKSAY